MKALLSHCVSFGSGRNLRGCETKIKNFPKKVPNKYFDVKVEVACDEEKQKDKNAKVCGSGQRRPEKCQFWYDLEQILIKNHHNLWVLYLGMQSCKPDAA